jgi:hypothetical protein
VLCRRLDLYRRELLAVEGRESRRSTTRIVKEEKMDSQFWLGVIITVVVGLPGAYVIGILANMHTPRPVHFLESRKLLKTHKTRQQALRIFNRIKAFRDGTRDRYPFYILLASAAVVCGIIASTLFLSLSFRMNSLWPFPSTYSQRSPP